MTPPIAFFLAAVYARKRLRYIGRGLAHYYAPGKLAVIPIPEVSMLIVLGLIDYRRGREPYEHEITPFGLATLRAYAEGAPLPVLS